MTQNEKTNEATVNPQQQETEIKRRAESKSFASTLKKGSNMASGILEHLELLSPRGLNEETSTRINTLVEDLKVLDNDQEILKGRLKAQTSELRDKSVELKNLLKSSGLIVKAVIPQMRWVDFGMKARR